MSKEKTIEKFLPKKNASKNKLSLVSVHDDSCFWVKDGQVLSDLIQLRDALSDMDEETFSHHVNKDKNDFADWVEAVLEDTELADSLRRSRKPNTAKAVIVKHLKNYDL